MLYLVQPENKVDKSGDVFSPEALKANDGKKVHVTIDFNASREVCIGTLKYCAGHGLFVDVNEYLEDYRALDGKRTAISCVIKHTEKISLIKECDVESVGCYIEPCDSEVSTIHYSGSDDE